MLTFFAKYYFDLFFNKEKNIKEKEITTRLEKRISKLEKENISLRDDLIKCKLEHIDEVMRIERSLNTQLKTNYKNNNNENLWAGIDDIIKTIECVSIESKIGGVKTNLK